MICHKCGKQQSDTFNFCNFCGASLKQNFLDCEDIKNNNNFDISANDNYENIHKKTDSYKIQNCDNTNMTNVVKHKKNLQVSGILSLVFGILACFCFLILPSVYILGDIYRNVVILFPCFTIAGFILSIISVYKDKNFNRVVISFYINFAMFLFAVMYFGYIILQKYS